MRRKRSYAWLGIHAALLTFGWIVLTVYSLHGAIPYNPVRLPFEDALNVSRLLPQGWAFFTRDPREQALTAYRVRADGKLELFGRTPHSRITNLFGLDRRSRAEGVELALLVAAAEETDASPWSACSGAPDECARRLLQDNHLRKLDQVMPRPLVCGVVILKLQAPVPWAWNQSPPLSWPSKLMALKVRC